MKTDKPDRSVSNMSVLKDIRGLLSTTRDKEGSTETRSREDGVLEAEAARLKEQIRRYEGLLQEQREKLHRLESENTELVTRLNALFSGKDKPMSPVPGPEVLREEIAQLEARKDERSSLLSQIEALLQLKVRELLKRIANVYQEAGQGDTAREFRKAANELEHVETFACFVQSLLNQ
jgi:DNA repair exonuclease SbcCD ATPase subunit